MLANGSGAELIRQLSNALTKPLDDLELRQEEPPTLSAALRDNIFIFSGFKADNELREVSALLHDESGNTKPFNSFLQDVRAIDETYNKNYLYAEYNYATASCQMATKWKEWEADGDDYDLQYRTANDANVREEHRALHNTTLPMSDPFWNSYLPPNGWNCRCTAVQVRKGKYEVSNSAEAIAKGEAATALPKQKIFRFNPGKQMKVFPPKHPYFPKGCGNCGKTLLSYDPNSEQCRACKAIAKCKKTHDTVNIDRVKTYPNGGTVDVYRMIADRTSDDYNRIMDSAEAFASRGEHVTLTPRFHSPKNCEDYAKVYADIPKAYWGKCPDLKVGKYYYEHESFTTSEPKKALRNMLAHGLKQSDKIVIEQPGLTDEYILSRINDKIRNKVLVSEVWLKEGTALRLLYKKGTP